MRDVVARLPLVADDQEPQPLEVEIAGGPGGPLVGHRRGRFRAPQREPERERRAPPRTLAGRRQRSAVELRQMARYRESQAELPTAPIALPGVLPSAVREAVEQVGQGGGGDTHSFVAHL